MEELRKMEGVLTAYLRREVSLLKSISRKALQCKGAVEPILQRRFDFDKKRLEKDLDELQGKIAWAKRRIDEIHLAMNVNTQGTLIYQPFACLLKKSK